MSGVVSINNIPYNYRVSSMGMIYLNVDGDEHLAMNWFDEIDYEECERQVMEDCR